MADTNSNVGYGYTEDTVKQSTFNFGLNAANTFLEKFEFTPTGGKEGAEAEALEIVFNIGGTTKGYRQFPLTKVYGNNSEEITDTNAKEFQDAQLDFNARMIHIVHCFVDLPTIKQTLARPISGFKDYVNLLSSILPKDFSRRPLDIFLQYQWRPSKEQEKTYLEIPKKMKYGIWLRPAQPGTWEKKIVEKPTDDVSKALWYVNEKGEEHSFFRSGWFMNSNFAHQQGVQATNAGTNGAANSAGAAAMNTGTAAKPPIW